MMSQNARSYRSGRRSSRRALVGSHMAVLEARRMMSAVTVGSGGTYATLQAALADAAGVPAGSTITVKPGTYSTDDLYFIDRSLTIRSQSGNPADTILNAGNAAGGMQILADNVTIDGVTLSDTNGPGIGINDYRNSAHTVTGVTLNNVKVIASPTDQSGHGIYLGSVSNSTLSNVTVQTTKTSGIYLNDVTGTTVTGANVSSAPGASSTYSIVLTAGSSGNTVSSSTFTGGSSQAIFVGDGSDNTVIRGNTVSSPGTAIYLSGVTGTVVDSNVMTNTAVGANIDGIIVTGGSHSTAMTGNTIVNAGDKGIFADGSDGLVIVGNTVSNYLVSGVYLTGSSNDLVAGNSLTGNINASGQNGITSISSSNSNVIAYNTITKAYFDGILVDSSVRNQVLNNVITSAGVDGVTMAHNSLYNLVAGNTITFTSYDNRINGGANGVGVWMYEQGNYNWVFQNVIDNASENGIAVFHSSGNYVEGNDTTNDTNGGVFVTRYTDQANDTNADSVPVGNVITSQYSHGDDAFYLLARGAVDTLFTRNFTDGQNAASTYGFDVEKGSIDTVGLANILYHMGTATTPGAFAVNEFGNNQTLFARNRVFSPNIMYATVGTGPSGPTLSSNLSTTIALDEGPVFGGNFWSDASGVTGNPSTGPSPYSNFHDTKTGKFSSFSDRYPFADESLGQSYDVAVAEPAAGTTTTPGSTRTIRWTSAAAVFVDISLVPTGGGDAITIASSAPNTGLYRWTVPAGIAAGDYAVRITPKNSAGTAAGSPTDSGAITVTADSGKSLHLVSPTRDSSATSGAGFRVSWVDSGVSAVNVQAQVDGGAWQTLASNVAGNYADVTLPSATSAAVRVRVVDANGTLSDTMDGTFSLTNGSGAFVSSPAGTAAVGSLQPLQWRSPTGTGRVTLEYSADGGSTFTKIASDLADTGTFTWVVPDANASNAVLRLTFKDASGNTIATTNSAAFSIPGQGNTITYQDGQGGNGGGGGGGTPTVDFTGTVSTGKLSASYISDGKTKLSAKLTLTANNVAFNGTVPVSYFLLPSGGDASAATPIATTLVKGSIKAGKAKTVSSSFVIPANLDGTYNIVYRINEDGTTVPESDKTNNVATGPAVTIHKPAIDLGVSFKAPVPTAVVSGNKKAYVFSVVITNTGNVAATGAATVDLLRSADATPDTGDAGLLSKAVKKYKIAAGKSLTVKFSYKAPVGGAAGDDFVIASLDNLTTNVTEDTSNNFASTPVTFS